MQPWYEAASLQCLELAGREVPPLATQIADGENGGVLMNEFPRKYREVVGLASGSDVPLMNVSEYLECLADLVSRRATTRSCAQCPKGGSGSACSPETARIAWRWSSRVSSRRTSGFTWMGLAGPMTYLGCGDRKTCSAPWRPAVLNSIG
jgi:hypothetical protein